MITGEYIVDYIGFDSNSYEISKGNSIISNSNFKDANSFYNYVRDNIVKECPQISNIRIVGVFKL